MAEVVVVVVVVAAMVPQGTIDRVRTGLVRSYQMARPPPLVPTVRVIEKCNQNNKTVA